jgi:phosphatidylserine/phosphatidylglycerophosphate/cardiolipin synthase-like enzyme
MGNPIDDPLNITLPESLHSGTRNIYVAAWKTCTFRLMHDPLDSNRDRWFNNTPAVTDGNEVKYLIRGTDAYEDMASCIRAAGSPVTRDLPRQGPAVIYLLGWDLNGNSYFGTELVAGDGESTVEKLFQKASANGAEIRVMAWANGVMTPFEKPSTIYAIDAINRIPTGRGIVDWKTGIWWNPPVTNSFFHIGAHHQKVLVTRGPGKVAAFLGGIDIDPTRIDKPAKNAILDFGWQDVHCRIVGPAANSVMLLFRQRWDDYINGNDKDANHDQHKPTFKDALDEAKRNRLTADQIPPDAVAKVDNAPYRQSVQICRTFHSGLYDRIAPGGLGGEKTIRDLVKRAVGQAERFIYMEDQYLFSMEISDALKAALAKASFRCLIILITHDEQINAEIGGQGSYRRALFIQNLKSGPGGEKVKVFKHKSRYVHAKIYLVDDKFAIIGSANCNRRGMQHDSEVAAGIFDRSSDKEEVLHFARRLRMRLWATHFNFSGQSNDPNRPTNDDSEFCEVADGVGSAVHWMKLPPNARVMPYQENNDLNLAIQTLKQKKAELIDRAKKSVPRVGNQPSAIEIALILYLNRYTNDQAGVDKAWDELFDPKDP